MLRNNGADGMFERTRTRRIFFIRRYPPSWAHSQRARKCALWPQLYHGIRACCRRARVPPLQSCVRMGSKWGAPGAHRGRGGDGARVCARENGQLNRPRGPRRRRPHTIETIRSTFLDGIARCAVAHVRSVCTASPTGVAPGRRPCARHPLPVPGPSVIPGSPAEAPENGTTLVDFWT